MPWLSRHNIAVGGFIVLTAAALAILDRHWWVGVIWGAYFLLLIARYHFFPPSRRPLHPPNESTLQWLRRRRSG
jgi:hypothetical protein